MPCLTDNVPLREISERLYFRTTRIGLKSVFASVIDLGDEARVLRPGRGRTHISNRAAPGHAPYES
ncbi:MAG: hypothetical protein AAF982_09115 [Pseudomonadota bacterium]